MGRPTDYKPEYVQKLYDYFSEPPYKTVTKTRVINGEKIETESEEATDFKSLAGFAVSIGVHRETLLEWSKLYPDFSDAYRMAKSFQENWMSVNGPKDLVNSQFTIFLAKNVLDWRDKKEVEHSGEQTVINLDKTDVQDRINQLKDK